jgi:hypothetical protein
MSNLPPVPYGERECPAPPYNATNFTAANAPVYSTLISYAKNSPNYPWANGVNAQEIYRSNQNTSYFNAVNLQTQAIKTQNNTLGPAFRIPYPQFKTQAERLMYIQGQALTAARNNFTGQNPSGPAGVPCSTIYKTNKIILKMNIFVLHPNQRKAARWHVDAHCIKMLLETCQLLYTAHWVLFYTHLQNYKSAVGLSRAQKQLEVPEYMWSAPVCDTNGEIGYRPCHVWHPCAIWTRNSSGNYLWLAELGLELAREYRFRFRKEHSCEKHIKWLYDNLPLDIEMKPRIDFAIAMGDEYKNSNDPIVCYRNYYKTQKSEKGIIKYTRRHKPHWLTV